MAASSSSSSYLFFYCCCSLHALSLREAYEALWKIHLRLDNLLAVPMLGRRQAPRVGNPASMSCAARHPSWAMCTHCCGLFLSPDKKVLIPCSMTEIDNRKALLHEWHHQWQGQRSTPRLS